MSVADTQSMTVRPRCCSLGDEYIRIHAANMMHGPDTTNWAIPLHREHGDVIVENVGWCPWCGKELSK